MEWQAQFKEAVAQYVIDRGKVMLKENSYYGGPYDWEATFHLRGDESGTCHITKWSDLREDEWDEFDGTFNDSLHDYGISIQIDCACGKLNGRRILENAKFGDVLRHLIGFE